MPEKDHRSDIEQLRQISIELEANFIEEQNAARLEFDNKHGSGYINIYEVFPGLVAKTFNVIFTKEWKFSKKETKPSPTYFIYCIKGHYYHRCQGEETLEKIRNMQNVILLGCHEKSHEIILPENIDLQISILFLTHQQFDFKSNRKFRMLEENITQLSEQLTVTNRLKYHGEISLETLEFAKILTTNKRLDIIGKLIIEGAILNTLATQLLSHEKGEGIVYPGHGLTNDELRKLVDLGDFIAENIQHKVGIKELVAKTNLYPKKLQAGCRYLYGASVSQLIHRVRMEKARQLLQDSNLNVSEVSYQIGISSRSYFSKVFHEAYGMSPTEFKKLTEGDTLVYELSYRSKASRQLSKEDLQAILEKSRKKNKVKNITGALVYHSNAFFQIVEGSKKDILELYETLLNDDRHHDVELLWKGFTGLRNFGHWSMAFLTEKEHEKMKADGIGTLLSIDSAKKNDFNEVFRLRVINVLKTQRAS